MSIGDDYGREETASSA